MGQVENIPSNEKNELSKYQPNFLSATSNIQINKSTRAVFDRVIDSDEAYNIAITGPYSSGKSSFIKSYKEHNKSFKDCSIDISLACFEQSLEPKNKQDTHLPLSEGGAEFDIADRKANFSEIEKSVIQQIIYKVPSSQIPKSRFSKLAMANDSKSFGFYLRIALWLLSSFFILDPKNFIFVDPFRPILGRYLDIFNIFFTVFAVGYWIFGLSHIIKYVRNNIPITKISYLNPMSAEVSFFSENDSILNRSLDELVYFFSNTTYNKVIFEDLERLGQPYIFTKLREINIILNNSYEVRNKHKKGIKFIYVTKDDCFSAEDRTKFFDFILPIIPVIHSNNSYEQLLKLIGHVEGEKLSRPFLRDVTVFIKDMRLLQNIVNEFYLYKKQVNHDDSLLDDNLFSLLLCKSLYPIEFEKLQRNEGKICHAFNELKQFKEAYIEQIKEEIKGCEDEVLNIKKATRFEIDEYKVLIKYRLLEIRGCYQNFRTWVVNNTSINNEDEVIELLLNGETLLVQDWNTNVLIKDNSDYKIVLGYLEDIRRLTNDTQAVNKHNTIKVLKNKILKLHTANLHQMCNLLREKQTEITGYDTEHLIHYLLRTGRIHENYQNYISIFYAGELTRKDFAFRNSVVYGTKTDFDYELDNPEKIVTLLDGSYFAQSAILNLDLFSYLISVKHEYLDLIGMVYDSEPNTSIKFIQRLEGERHGDIYLSSLLVKQKPDYLINCKNYYSNSDLLCYKLAEKLDFKDIKESNLKVFSETVEKDTSLIERLANSDPIFLENILLAGVHLTDYELELNDLKQVEVYKNLFLEGAIVVTPKAIEDYFACISKNKRFSLKNLFELNDTVLLTNIEYYLEELTELYWLQTTKDKLESENSILYLLASNVSISLLSKLIDSISEPLKDISNSGISREVALELLWKNKAIVNLPNLMAACPYANDVVDEDYRKKIDKLIVDHNENLISSLTNEYNEELARSFTSIILFDVIAWDSFIDFIELLATHIDSYDLENLGDEKYEYLLEHGFVNYSENLFNEFSVSRANLLPALIIHNKDAFEEEHYYEELTDDTLVAIYKHPYVDISESLLIFESLTENKIRSSKKLSKVYVDILIEKPSVEISESMFFHLVEHAQEDRRDKLITKLYKNFSPVYLINEAPFDCLEFLSRKEKIEILDSSHVLSEEKIRVIATLNVDEMDWEELDINYLSELAITTEFTGVHETWLIKLAALIENDSDLTTFICSQENELSNKAILEICATSNGNLKKLTRKQSYFELEHTVGFLDFSEVIVKKEIAQRHIITKANKIRVYLK